MLCPKAQFWSCSMTSCHWLNNIFFLFKTKQKLKPFTTVEPHIFSAFSAFLLLCVFSSVVWSNRINAAPLNHPLVLFALPPCIKHIGDASNPGLIPGLGRSPERGNGNPLQHSYLGKPMDRRAAGLQYMGHKESDATEHAYIELKPLLGLIIHLSQAIRINPDKFLTLSSNITLFSKFPLN